MFQAIQYVTGSLTLIAFIAATAAYVYRSRLRGRVQTIKQTQSKNQVDALEILQRFMHIDIEDLSRSQQFKLAMQQTTFTEHRFKLIWIAAMVIFLVSAGLAAAGQWYEHRIEGPQKPPEPYTVKNSVLVLDLRTRTETPLRKLPHASPSRDTS